MASNALTTTTHSQAEKPPAHLYHPGVASMPAGPEESVDTASVSGKRRRSSDGKKVIVKKKKKSQDEVESSPGESVSGNKSVESSPVSKMSPTTARGKKVSVEDSGQDIIQVTPLVTRSARGKKMFPEAPATTAFSTSTTVSVTTSMTTSMALCTTTTAVTISTTPTTQTLEPTSPSRTRRAQVDSTPPSVVPQVNLSPSHQRRQTCDTGETPPHQPISSPLRSRRNLADLNIDSTESQSQPSVQTDIDTVSSSGNAPAVASENSEVHPRRRTGSNIHLDTSVESLPSVTSLHSPTSESFHSAEDDPTSPRKEKRHRDGSKKKKKDKDKELDGVRKRKKHHHRDKHSLGEMASEMVTPVRIKVSNFFFFIP